MGVSVGTVSKPAPDRRDGMSGSFMEFKTSIPMMATNGMRDAAAMAVQVAMPTPLKREWRACVGSWWVRPGSWSAARWFGSCDDVPLSRGCEVGSGMGWRIGHGAKINKRFYCKTRVLLCTHASRKRCGGQRHSAGHRRG